LRAVVWMCVLSSHFTAETLARDIFKVVGGKLQQQRLQDFVQNFGSHLTDNYQWVVSSLLTLRHCSVWALRAAELARSHSWLDGMKGP